MAKLKKEGILCSYWNNKKNFIFELAQKIVEGSLACSLYLQARYFKIYIDEYQDCDEDMHKFFMYLCTELKIETFIVGDEKQSIYMWRGASPEAFKNIWDNPSFETRFMSDNFRSCQQIQNYSNLLCEETKEFYMPIKNSENIVWVSTTASDWAVKVAKQIDINKKSALLRFSNDNAKLGAKKLCSAGIECVYVPKIPVAEITTGTAWLYFAVAKYLMLEKYSVYDVISEMPSESDESSKNVNIVNELLEDIEMEVFLSDDLNFYAAVNSLANYLGYETREDHLEKLFSTISDERFRVAFKVDEYQHIAITLHSSKGLEFEQVIIFANDYKLSLSDMSSVYNHYVAVTRAKTKLIIVKLDEQNANRFQNNLTKIFLSSGVNIEDVVTFV